MGLVDSINPPVWKKRAYSTCRALRLQHLCSGRSRAEQLDRPRLSRGARHHPLAAVHSSEVLRAASGTLTRQMRAASAMARHHRARPPLKRESVQSDGPAPRRNASQFIRKWHFVLAATGGHSVIFSTICTPQGRYDGTGTHVGRAGQLARWQGSLEGPRSVTLGPCGGRPSLRHRHLSYNSSTARERSSSPRSPTMTVCALDG